MYEDAPERLIRFFHERSGNHLRTVAVYGAAGTEFVYMRDDLQTAYTENRGQLGQFMAFVEEVGAQVHGQPFGDSPLGEYRCTLHIHQEAFSLHLPETADSGMLVTLDTDVGANLDSLVQQCEDLAYEDRSY